MAFLVVALWHSPYLSYWSYRPQDQYLVRIANKAIEKLEILLRRFQHPDVNSQLLQPIRQYEQAARAVEG
jgi:hypothetical protein